MSTAHLPVAEPSAVHTYVRDLVSRRRRLAGSLVVLHVLATLAGLAAPALLGRLVEAVRTGTTTAYVDRIVLLLVAALVTQTVLTRAARYRGFVFGELTLAELREGFVKDSLAMPLGAVERAGSGELVTRTTRDVDALQWTAQRSLPCGRRRRSRCCRTAPSRRPRAGSTRSSPSHRSARGRLGLRDAGSR